MVRRAEKAAGTGARLLHTSQLSIVEPDGPGGSGARLLEYSPARVESVSVISLTAHPRTAVFCQCTANTSSFVPFFLSLLFPHNKCVQQLKLSSFLLFYIPFFLHVPLFSNLFPFFLTPFSIISMSLTLLQMSRFGVFLIGVLFIMSICDVLRSKYL